jgi:hypothetical protein
MEAAAAPINAPLRPRIGCLASSKALMILLDVQGSPWAPSGIVLRLAVRASSKAPCAPSAISPFCGRRAQANSLRASLGIACTSLRSFPKSPHR